MSWWVDENAVTRGSQDPNFVFCLGAVVQNSWIQCVQEVFMEQN